MNAPCRDDKDSRLLPGEPNTTHLPGLHEHEEHHTAAGLTPLPLARRLSSSSTPPGSRQNHLSPVYPNVVEYGPRYVASKPQSLGRGAILAGSMGIWGVRPAGLIGSSASCVSTGATTAPSGAGRRWSGRPVVRSAGATSANCGWEKPRIRPTKRSMPSVRR